MEEKEFEQEMVIYAEKPFNWKPLLKVLGIIVAVVVVAVGVRKLTGYLRGGDIAKYENGKSSTFQKVSKHCDFNLDKVNKIKITFFEPRKYEIGYLTDNYDYDSVFYMIYDEKEIEALIEKLKDMKMYGVNEDDFTYYENPSLDWELKLYVDDVEYSLILHGGYLEGQDEAEAVNIGVEHREFPVLKEEYPNPDWCLWSSRALIYNQELNDYIYDLYKKNIKNLTKEDILKLYDEGDLEKFFIFENSGPKERSYEEKIADGLHIHRYIFRMDDFDGYVVVEKQNEGVGAETFYTDVLDVKIYSADGEYIDYMKATRTEIEEFLK